MIRKRTTLTTTERRQRLFCLLFGCILLGTAWGMVMLRWQYDGVPTGWAGFLGMFFQTKPTLPALWTESAGDILLFLLPFMPASWLGLVITFQSYPIIQKYIINPYYEQRGEVNPELAQVSASEEETVFEDMGGKEKPIEPPKKAGGKQSGGGRTHKGKGKIIS